MADLYSEGDRADVRPMADADHRARLAGTGYRNFLNALHRRFRPRSYFEIGTLDGHTLRLADCASIAVDPAFQIEINAIGKKPRCLFFQETSDEFFKFRNPSRIFGRPIDLAYLDGMHLFEFLLRDFVNTERHCARSSLILMHDCLPPGFYMTARSMEGPQFSLSEHGRAWTGDVWKLIPVLRRYRPDLRIVCLDCPPTGLVLVTDLDPSNTTLHDAYDAIVAETVFREERRGDYEAFWRDLVLTDSKVLPHFPARP